MKRLVVDASVLAKLYFPEEHSDRADRALRGGGRGRGVELIAPDLLWAEFPNIVRKKQCRGDISPEKAREAVREALSLPIRLVPAADLAAHALELALETGRTVYDSLYVAVAISEKAIVLTADERLANASRAGPFGKYIKWIGEPD